MERTLMIEMEKCTGCRICELICSMEKRGEYNPQKSYIRVLRNREMDVNIPVLDVRCDLCNKCVEWCPTKTLSFVSWEEASILRKENKPGIMPAIKRAPTEAKAMEP